MLALTDKWVWDFWFATDDDGAHHIFYLQAPRALKDPELRHHNASIGHAVSPDYRAWTVLSNAVEPGDDGEWDDLATWTGSVLRDGTCWRMLYTGVCRRDGGLVQRIGLATSTDLVSWRKHEGNPLIEADGRWYEELTSGRWRDQSWRDPYLYRLPGDDAVHVLITARSPAGAPDGAGVIARARSADFVKWEVLPPLTAPGDFAQVEVPQPVRIGGRCAVLFSCWAEDHSAERRKRLGVSGSSGTFAYVKGDSGELSPSTDPVVACDREILYAGKVVTENDGSAGFIAFRGPSERGFIGELTDPMPIGFDDDGRLAVMTS